MKNFFKGLGILSILVFSFYYTDKIALLVQSKNPVLKEIKMKKSSLEVPSIDATVIDENIIPGVSGSVVNVEKSFLKMKALNKYNEYYLVYDEVTPKVSLENNKDKIIISGNKTKNNISLILEDKSMASYFKGYHIDVLTTKDTYQKSDTYELINNEKEEKLYRQVNTLLDKDKINKNICLLNESNRDLCQKSGNYVIKHSLKLTNSNIIDVKNKLENGSIILISANAKLEDLKILLKEIKFKDLEIVYLSKLIEE